MTVVVHEKRSTAPRGWSGPDMAEIANVARDSAGLVFSANRIPSAEQGILRAMKTMGITSPARFRESVSQPGPAREALLAELTVGESYFFREPAQLDFIARELLPEFSEQRRAASEPSPLRMWSAGCANGEEPYSLAMLLRESAWRYDRYILGTDISVPRLITARRGRYAEWAMRATPQVMIERYFERTGKQYVVRRELREMVEFRAVNLVSDAELVPRGSSRMDVILCRNVLIYFSMETVAKVAERLLESLAPDGWLLISASDPPLTDLVRCETVTTSAGLAYRRADRPGISPTSRLSLRWPEGTPADVAPSGTARPLGEPMTSGTAGAAVPPFVPAVPSPVLSPVAGASSQSPRSPAAQTVDSAYAAGDFDSAARLAATRVATGEDDERTRVQQVRALANRGRLEEAGAACAAALDRFPLSPELHLMHAVLLARAGMYPDTIVATRRALYLDPGLVMAQIVGADAMTRTGDRRGAERALRAASTLLAELPAEQPVAAADGETAGRLRQLVAFHLKALAGEGAQ